MASFSEKKLILAVAISIEGDVGVLYRQPTEGYPEVIDWLVGDRRTWNSNVKARTQDTYLYRFGPPE